MIDRHWDGIAAYCNPENKVSLGFVEGLNNSVPQRHERSDHELMSSAVQLRREMRVGPSGSTFRRRSQTSLSCFGKEPRW
jgi:hypothetical protein